MCGIVGYVGGRPAREVLLAGLEKLEYRGYDSAGISVLGADGEIESVRAVGNLAALRGALNGTGNGGVFGIGHTRWATHGRVSERNAHPHDDCAGRVHIALNGIVENFVELRRRLEAGGCGVSSATDAPGGAPPLAGAHAGGCGAAAPGGYH